VGQCTRFEGVICTQPRGIRFPNRETNACPPFLDSEVDARIDTSHSTSPFVFLLSLFVWTPPSLLLSLCSALSLSLSLSLSRARARARFAFPAIRSVCICLTHASVSVGMPSR
jgi:hypothetical protein